MEFLERLDRKAGKHIMTQELYQRIFLNEAPHQLPQNENFNSWLQIARYFKRGAKIGILKMRWFSLYGIGTIQLEINFLRNKSAPQTY